MPLDEIRTEIVNILNSVPNIGKVYPYLRWSADWQSFLNMFKSGTTYRGFMVTRTSTIEKRELETEHNTRLYTFKIVGFDLLNDENQSELVFQSLVEDICSKFRTNYNLNGKVLDTEMIDVNVFENRMFGSILVHWVELTLIVKERIRL